MRTIVWDVDDVLNDLMRVWLETYWLPSHAECRVLYGDLRSNPPNGVLGSTRKEYLQSLDQFRRARFSDLEPGPEALEWFRRRGERYRHMALTAVPLEFASLSAAWVLRHFGRWIRSFHVVPSKRAGQTAPAYDGTKQEFLYWLGKPVILVDDNAAYVETARAAGFDAVLMPRPWNGSAAPIAAAFDALEHFQ
jgi:phosphoglycolate phosphatase-like HAD superfamily hydrolase